MPPLLRGVSSRPVNDLVTVSDVRSHQYRTSRKVELVPWELQHLTPRPTLYQVIDSPTFRVPSSASAESLGTERGIGFWIAEQPIEEREPELVVLVATVVLSCQGALGDHGRGRFAVDFDRRSLGVIQRNQPAEPEVRWGFVRGSSRALVCHDVSSRRPSPDVIKSPTFACVLDAPHAGRVWLQHATYTLKVPEIWAFLRIANMGTTWSEAVFCALKGVTRAAGQVTIRVAESMVDSRGRCVQRTPGREDNPESSTSRCRSRTSKCELSMMRMTPMRDSVWI